MLASEYIKVLQALVAEHGDLPVDKWLPSRGRHEAPVPKLAYRRKFGNKRGAPEVVPQFYNPVSDNLVQQGDPVIRV